MNNTRIWTRDRVAAIADEYKASNFFILTLNGADALGFKSDDGMFAVAPGSRLGPASGLTPKLSRMFRASLSRLNLINDDMTLKDDERFLDASEAACFVSGCLCDGRSWVPYELIRR